MKVAGFFGGGLEGSFHFLCILIRGAEKFSHGLIYLSCQKFIATNLADKLGIVTGCECDNFRAECGKYGL